MKLRYMVLVFFTLVFVTGYEMAFAQTKVSGTVTNVQTGNTLPGVNIFVKNAPNMGTSSDVDGHYELNVPSLQDTLVFSFIGFETQRVPIRGRQTIDVALSVQAIEGEELVVIGYGSVQESDLTGSVGSVGTDELDQQVNSNLGSAIQGKISGVSVESSSGAPGSGMNLQIRGAGSLNNNNPLILVDNIPVTSMNNINPNDIESLQVLKDASAAAIYGSRAANGVILITTKGGHDGKVQVSASADFGIQQIGKKLDLATTDEWIKIITKASDAASLAVPEVARNPEEPGKGVDWQDEIFRTAPVQDYNIGVSGGSENLNYNVSLGYLDEQGIIEKTDYSRLNLRIKSDFTKGRVKVGESIMLTRETTSNMPGVAGQGGNVIGSAQMMIPGFSIHDENAQGGYGGASGGVLDVYNPVAALNLMSNETDYNKALINLYGEVDILEGLTYKLNTGITHDDSKNYTREQAYQVGTFFSNTQNYAYRDNWTTKYWQIENTLSYDEVFAGKHSVNAVAGYTVSKNEYNGFSSSVKGMSDGIWVLDGGSDNPTSGGMARKNTMISYLGRVIYSYDDRYILTGTFRRDGSSRFSETNRWGNFPSVSAAWNISNESFFKNLNVPVTQLKLRASYGKLGNQEIGDYQYIGAITSGVSYAYGDPNTLWVGNIQTEYVPQNLKWETTTTTNLGLDLSLFEDRLNYTVDMFQKNTTDLLLRVPIPLSAGANDNPFSNAGEIENRGLEMKLNYNDSFGDFSYSVTGTFSHIENEVKELATGSQVLTGSEAIHNGPAVTYTKVGYPIYSFFLIETDGLFRSQEEIQAHSQNGELIQPNAQVGDMRFVDANKDGQINGNDRVYSGSPFPDYSYGLRLEGNWRFLEASVYFQGTQGNKIYNGIRTYTESAVYVSQYSSRLLDSYSFNPNSDIPRIDLNDPNGNGVSNSDRFLEDGSYLRLKTIQLGFVLPHKWNQRLGIQRARIYVGANNLFTWTKYKGYNPDIGNSSMSARGIDFRQYPLNKSYHIGIKMNF